MKLLAVLGAAAAVVMTALVVRSLPELKRYLKIRAM